MALSTDRPGSRDLTIEAGTDRSLNYYSDQLPDIKKNLRQLNLAWGFERVRLPLSVVFISGALGFLLKRRFAAASLFALGLLFQQILQERQPLSPPLRNLGVGERNELELERYAMKVQRGDYGKIEVIPFR
jgi:hypothetical protein